MGTGDLRREGEVQGTRSSFRELSRGTSESLVGAVVFVFIHATTGRSLSLPSGTKGAAKLSRPTRRSRCRRVMHGACKAERHWDSMADILSSGRARRRESR